METGGKGRGEGIFDQGEGQKKCKAIGQKVFNTSRDAYNSGAEGIEGLRDILHAVGFTAPTRFTPLPTGTESRILPTGQRQRTLLLSGSGTRILSVESPDDTPRVRMRSIESAWDGVGDDESVWQG